MQIKLSQSRAQFLTGDLAAHLIPIRPPWAVDEQDFFDRCTGCQKCVQQCEENIIKSGRASYPIVDFNSGTCTFCAACVECCQTGALLKTVEAATGSPWSIKAFITDACLSLKKVVCRNCNEQCELHAIQFNYQKNGVFIPQINVNLCTGCGACFKPCPVNAIKIKSQ